MKFAEFLKGKVNDDELSEKLMKIENDVENDKSENYKVLIYEKLKNNLTINEIIFLATVGFDFMITDRKIRSTFKNIKL